MSTSVVPVQPGDIITSEMWNDVLTRLAAAEALLAQLGQPANLVDVPRLFNLTLTQARTTLTQATVGLNLGTVLDSAGALVNPNANQSINLRVIGQSPGPRTRVVLGSSVDLLVAAPASSAPPTPVAPSILRFEDVSGNVLTQAPAGTTIVVVGQNFDVVRNNNTVVFTAPSAPGSPARVTPDAATVTRLTVRVPTTLPGTPTGAGVLAVLVAVETASGGPSGTMAYNIAAPPAVPDPAITEIRDTSGNALLTARLGSSMVLIGTAFTRATGTAQVGFLQQNEAVPSTFPAGRIGTLSNVTDTSATVAIPNSTQMQELVPAGLAVPLDVVFRRGDGRTVRFTQDFRRSLT